MTKKINISKRLDEVVVIRIALIFLLVLYHSFCMYSGAWRPLDGMPDVPVYWWISKTSYSFMLEKFVMISGYLFVFQLDKRKKIEKNKEGGKTLIINKLKRLILPCLIFSFVYIILFHPTLPGLGVFYDIINGVAHMWFLPMLFWCFVMTYFLRMPKIKEEIKLLGLFMCALLPAFPIPLRIGNAVHYLFFFYLGGYFWIHKEIFLNVQMKHIIATAILYIVSFLTAWIQPNEYVRWFLIPIYATMGCLLLYMLALRITLNKQLSPWMHKLSSMCFGVYLFQQFILIGLYWHTPLVSYVGYYAMPWVGFVVAIFGSLVLTYVMRLTKVGKFLIG